MEYTFGVLNRFALARILPPENSLATMKIVRDLKMELAFGEMELGDLNLRPSKDGAGTQWDPIPDKPIEIGAAGQRIIRDALKKLDKDKTLRVEHIELCEMFEYESD